MKKVISSGLLLLFLAVTFVTDTPPPGWYQQTLPVSDQINDIFFLDSLTGWVVTNGATTSSDTGYIIKTTDGGTNWSIQFYDIMKFNTVQFLDNNTGYASGGNGPAKVFKTTDSGQNWFLVGGSLLGFGTLEDLFFVNSATGWICDMNGFGGLAKTTNGGVNWQLQLNDNYRPQKLFFINSDTGWAGSSDWKLYRTTNGGINWELQYSFASGIFDFYFLNGVTGWLQGGGGGTAVKRTYNGGFNWIGLSTVGGGNEIQFLSDSVGYGGASGYIITKTTNGGTNWIFQTSPIFNNNSIYMIDTLIGWAGGNGLVHTTDGGGPPQGIIKSNTTVSAFKLKQNYPNPFNGVTLIFFDLPRESRVDLRIYNILGEEVSELLDDEYFTAGTVQFGFDSNKEELSSGVYFYRLTARAVDKKEIFIDTKKMVLIK